MGRRKRGLQKDVSSIFSGVVLQDVIHQGLSQVPPTQGVPARAACPSAGQSDDDAPAQDLSAQNVISSSRTEPKERPQTESTDLTGRPESPPDLNQDEKIQQLKATVSCTKDFSCMRSGLSKLCKARLGRNGKVVQCLEDKKHPCSFRLSFLFKKICRCPLRQHIAKHWGK